VRFLRSLLIALITAIPLLGATPTFLLPPPVVVVYPFVLNGSDVDKESGAKLAVIIATGIANHGGVTVKPAPPGTERKNFLTAARDLGADYYVTGYITPLGNEVTVVEQVVSTINGIVILNNTAQLTTYADANGQGENLGDAILHHHNRNLDAFQGPPAAAQATPTPEPSTGPQADLGKLFGRRKAKPTPAPSTAPVAQTTPAAQPTPATIPAAASVAGTPTPAPAPLPTARPAPVPTATPAPVALALPARSAETSGTTVGLLAVGGSASESLRSAARADLEAAFARAKLATTPLDSATCRGDVARVASGVLTIVETSSLGQPQDTATFDLTVSDCEGKVLFHKSYDHDAGQAAAAVERAVNEAAAAYARPPRKR